MNNGSKKRSFPEEESNNTANKKIKLTQTEENEKEIINILDDDSEGTEEMEETQALLEDTELKDEENKTNYEDTLNDEALARKLQEADDEIFAKKFLQEQEDESMALNLEKNINNVINPNHYQQKNQIRGAHYSSDSDASDSDHVCEGEECGICGNILCDICSKVYDCYECGELHCEDCVFNSNMVFLCEDCQEAYRCHNCTPQYAQPFLCEECQDKS